MIKIDIDSLYSNVDQNNKALRETKALKIESIEGGANPNFLKILNFDIDLPKDKTLCPFLTCTVYD